MTIQHSYIACVRESTRDLPNIDSVQPFSSTDESCLKDLNEVLRKHGAVSRFGINLLHSHFEMSDDEVLLEETDVIARKQTLSVIKKSEVPAGAIYMDRRFDTEYKSRCISLFEKMKEHNNSLLINKLRFDFSISEVEANALLDDVKRFIALCLNSPEPLAPPRRIDQGWHQFIMITMDYSKFCTDYCGRYVHHQPADPFVQSKDYSAARQVTRDMAQSIFGELSLNWSESLAGGSCTHNCGGGKCDEVKPS